MTAVVRAKSIGAKSYGGIMYTYRMLINRSEKLSISLLPLSR